MRTPSLLPLAVTLSLACAEGHGDAKVASTITTDGDTTVITISAPESLPALLVTLDSPRMVWTPEELGRPNGLVVGPDGRITVSDRAHVYAMPPGADTTETVGREGDGPGEYRSVRALLAEPTGAFTLLDPRARRMIHFGPRGMSDSTWPVNRDFDQSSFLANMNGALVVAVGAPMVHTGEPPDTLYLKLASGDTGTVVGRLTQYVWAQTPSGMLAPRDAYPPQALLSGTAMSGFAFSDGLAYQIRWWRPEASPHWLHIARAWAPPPTSIDRDPPESLIAGMRGGSDMVKMVGSMRRGEHKYSLEEIALMPGGTLWAQPVDSSYVYHPWYYNQLTQLRPPTRLWEVFGPDGKLRAQVRLSSMFTPKTVRDCQLYGFLEDSDGAYSVATVPLEEACEKLSGT
jgi:hypothetical protein